MTGVIDNSLIDPSVFTDSVNAFLPNIAYVPFSQDGRETLAACVEPGDVVAEGDAIALPRSETGAAIHTPIPGKVESFISCLAPNGKKTLAVKIKLSGAFSYLGKGQEKNTALGIKKAKLKALLADKGVLNTFLRPVPLAKQISDLPGNKMCVLAVRLFDNDPSQKTDSFVAEKYCAEVAEGAAILAGAINAKGVIFLSDKKMNEKCRETYWDCNYPCGTEFFTKDAKQYPGGTEREIIRAARSSSAAHAFGSISNQDLFVDSSTLLNVYRAAVLSTPVMETFVHVSGAALKKPGMFSVRVGTLIQDIVEECGGFVKRPEIAVINGKVQGMSIGIIDVPVTKYVKSIRFLLDREIPDQRISECVRCGRCRLVCPSGLEPDVLFVQAGASAREEAAFSSLLCTDCGLCNSACPSRLPLSQSITLLKESYKE